jgi:hypothetical protein
MSDGTGQMTGHGQKANTEVLGRRGVRGEILPIVEARNGEEANEGEKQDRAERHKKNPWRGRKTKIG